VRLNWLPVAAALKFCFETCVAMKFVDDDDYGDICCLCSRLLLYTAPNKSYTGYSSSDVSGRWTIQVVSRSTENIVSANTRRQARERKMHQ